MKSKTHIYMANLVMKELKENGTVTIKEVGTFQVPEDIKKAILSAPCAFRAGSVGPDFYPDMLIGQTIIHPSDSGKWLEIMEEELRKVSRDSAEWNEAYAFYLGYMFHYAGDMWGHYYVNAWSKGSFPEVKDMIKDSEKAKIAIRHILVETYIDSKIPKSESMEVRAPIPFLYRCFTSPKALKNYGENDTNVLKYLLTYRDEVHQKAADTTIRTMDIFNYFASWEEQLDTAIMEWFKLWDEIARDMLMEDGGLEKAKSNIEKWIKDYAIKATAIPEWVIEIAKAMKIVKVTIEMILEPLKQMIIKVLEKILYAVTGIKVEDIEQMIAELKKMMKNPELYLNNGILYDEKDITTKLDEEFGNYGQPDATLHNQTFLAFDRCLNMCRMVVMGADNLTGLMKKYSSSVVFHKKKLLASVAELSITIETSDRAWSGTDDNLYFGLVMNDGTVLEYLMDKMNYNDFERGDRDTYNFVLPRTVLYSDIKECRIRKDYISVSDDWRMESIQVRDAADGFILVDQKKEQELTGRNSFTFQVRKKEIQEEIFADAAVMAHLYSLDVATPPGQPDYKSWEDKKCFLNSSEQLWTEFTKKVFKL